MKISAQDEYGLRTLLRIAQREPQEGLSIAQLSELEGLSRSYMAKLTRKLRLEGFIKSTPGPKGGYVLAKSPEEISVNEVLKALDGKLFSNEFCKSHSGDFKVCARHFDCSVRSLWKVAQLALDHVFDRISLQDLMGSESEADHILQLIADEFSQAAQPSLS